MVLEEIAIKKIGDLESVSQVLEKIDILSEKWDLFPFLIKKFTDTQDCKIIPILWSEKLVAIQKWPVYDLFKDEIDEINSILKSVLDPTGEIINATLVMLEPGKQIRRFKDPILSQERYGRCHRIHIPIALNDGCSYEAQIDPEPIELEQGGIYQINRVSNTVGFKNDGGFPRYHLSIDFIPGEILEKYSIRR